MITVRKTAKQRPNKVGIENKKDKRVTSYLYGEIGGWLGIDHLEWVKQFNAIDADIIDLRVDSFGGEMFAARTMKTAIMQHKAKVIAHIDGVAASAASFLVMGADEIEIVEGGFMMIHNALVGLDILGFFNASALKDLISELQKEYELHGQLNESIANDYAKRTGMEVSTLLDWMNKEKWIGAKEALENKFVDRIYDGEPVKANYDLSMYNNVPDELKKRNEAVTEQIVKKDLNQRDLEKNLRDAGYSRNQAKEIVAKVFQDEREAQTETIEQDEREAQIVDSEPPQVKKKDRTADLLTRAEMVAPSIGGFVNENNIAV